MHFSASDGGGGTVGIDDSYGIDDSVGVSGKSSASFGAGVSMTDSKSISAIPRRGRPDLALCGFNERS
jgi:hypothetical protein